MTAVVFRTIWNMAATHYIRSQPTEDGIQRPGWQKERAGRRAKHPAGKTR